MISMVYSSHELVLLIRSTVYLGLNHQNIAKILKDVTTKTGALVDPIFKKKKILKQSPYQENCKVKIVDLKQTARKHKQTNKKYKIGCQVFLQQRWAHLGSAENCNFRVCNHDRPHANPCTAKEGEQIFLQRKKLGGLQQTQSP